MEEKLFNALMKFIRVCDAKLTEKEEKGWVGWDNPEYEKEFEGEIVIQSLPLTQNDCVNIANYCMFLWNLKEIRKEELCSEQMKRG